MTELRISDAVCAAFGGVRIAAIAASGFAGRLETRSQTVTAHWLTPATPAASL